LGGSARRVLVGEPHERGRSRLHFRLGVLPPILSAENAERMGHPLASWPIRGKGSSGPESDCLPYGFKVKGSGQECPLYIPSTGNLQNTGAGALRDQKGSLFHTVLRSTADRSVRPTRFLRKGGALCPSERYSHSSLYQKHSCVPLTNFIPNPYGFFMHSTLYSACDQFR